MALWIKAEDGYYVNVSEAMVLMVIEPNLFRAPCQVVANVGGLAGPTVICTLPSREEAERVLWRIAADLGAKSYTDYTQPESRAADR